MLVWPISKAEWTSVPHSLKYSPNRQIAWVYFQPLKWFTNFFSEVVKASCWIKLPHCWYPLDIRMAFLRKIMFKIQSTVPFLMPHTRSIIAWVCLLEGRVCFIPLSFQKYLFLSFLFLGIQFDSIHYTWLKGVKVIKYSLVYAKYGFWTSSTSISWDFGRNARFRPHPRLTKFYLLGLEICV